ncbi:MAG: YtxH domain-containing protein [Ferruginibacter sp.]|nr:YtxH domain-containing protein [Cytophagales bacterium]
MDNEKKEQTDYTLSTFLLGATLGFAVGILLAPYTGGDARSKIAERATDLWDQFGGSFQDVIDLARSKVDDAVNQAGKYTK